MRKFLNVLEKRTTEILILTTIILFAGVGVQASGVLDSGSSGELVAEYRFDTGAGDTAYDTAGSNDGSLTNFDFDSDDGWVSGIRGKALEFSGEGTHPDTSDTIVETSLDSDSFDNEITVSWWGKITDAGEYVNSGGLSNGFAFYTGAPRFIITDTDGNFEYASGNGVEDGKWHHFVGVYDNSLSENQIKLYIDGNLVDEVDGPGNMQDWNKVAIGGANGGDYRTVDGLLDQIRIYSKALNQSQIKSLYNQGSFRKGEQSSDDPDKVLDLSMQHKNSSHVLDTSGYNNHGEKVNSPSQETAGGCKVGRCYSFDGSDGTIETSVHPKDIGIEDNKEKTIMAWTKVNTFDTAGIWEIGLTEDSKEFSMRTKSSQDNFRAQLWSSGDIDFSCDASGKWAHVTLTHDGSVTEVYCNGLKAASQSQTVNTTKGQPFTIGERRGNVLDGKIDQVKIFNRSLSQAEIIEKTEGLESNGAVLDMRFNSGGGDHVGDHSIQENHGVLKPNETAGPSLTKGVRGSAYNFDGDDDLIDINDFSYGETVNEISFSFWMRSDGRFGEYRRPINNADNIFGGGADDTGFDVMVGLDDKLQVGINGVNSDNGVKARDIFELEKGEFYHVVGTWNGSELEVYVDGALNKTVSGSTDGELNRGTLTIGARNTGGQKWNGLVDEVKIYPFSVSEQKVEKLYQQGAGFTESPGNSVNLQDGLVLDQTFNRIETCGQSDTLSCPSGMSGEVAVDESEEGNHGELVNGPTAKSSGDCKVGGCLGFDGSDDYVDIDRTIYSNHTVAFWMKTSSSSSSEYPISQSIGVGNYDSSFVQRPDNTLDWALNGSSTNTLNLGNLPTNEWVFVAGKNNPKGEAAGYINGEKTDSMSGVSWKTSESNLLVGNIRAGDSLFYEGIIDQVRVYNRSLSDKQVWKLYTQGRDRRDGMGKPVGHWKFDSGKVGTEDNPAYSCRQIHELRPNAASGKYWIEGSLGPDNAFQVECEMSDNGGGWTNISLDHPDSHLAVGNDPDRCSGAGDSAKHFDHISTSDYNFLHDTDNHNIYDYIVNYTSGGNSLSTDQKEVLSRRVKQVSDTTQPIGVSCDDDSPSISHNTYLYDQDGNSFELQDGYVSNSNNIGWWLWHHTSSTTSTESTASISGQDSSSIPGNFIMPTDIGLQTDANGYAVFGYEKHYGLVRDGRESWILDETSEDNTGNIIGDPQWTNGKKGKALEFDGVDDGIDVNYDIDYSKDSVSVGAWVKQTGQASSDFQRITDGDLTYWVDDGSDFTCVRLTATESGGASQTCFGTDLEKNTWYHLLFTYKSSSSETKLYVDGEKFGSSNYYSGEMDGTASSLTIGNTAGGGRPWKGKIDDVRIYPYALNEEQVKQVKNGGAVSVG